MNTDISVTVIVPSYNHEEYIQKCIESIMHQSYRNFELIVVDDGSNDGSVEKIVELQSKYNFKAIFQENLGLAKTMNKCLMHYCNSKYFTFCASDDYWAEKKLEYQVSFMEANPNIFMCFGKNKIVKENGSILEPNNPVYRGGWIFNDIFTLKYHLPVSYLFRSEVFERIGLYDENLFAEDFDMNLRISSMSQIGFIDEYLIYYRVIDISSKLSRYDRIIDSHLASINKFRNHQLYPQAKKMVLLGRLYAYSTLKTKKIKSLYLFITLWSLLPSKTYLRAIYNFLFIWR